MGWQLREKAFSVHQKHSVVQKMPLEEAIEHLKSVDTYLKRSTDEAMSLFNKTMQTYGNEGNYFESNTIFSLHDT